MCISLMKLLYALRSTSDSKDDFVIFQINYDQFMAERDGLDLYFKSVNGHAREIKICNWFHSAKMVFYSKYQ